MPAMWRSRKETNHVVRDVTHPRIVVIGGGTGSFTLLQTLKHLTPDITALVNMADDGGSTGLLRDELGVLPPGDVRQCLVALSAAPQEMRELFNFRFAEGSFAGHSFGNIFLSAVEKMTDNFEDAVRMASDVLRITGEVVPITLENCQLILQLGEKQVVGEYEISETRLESRPELSLKPHASINPIAKARIKNADLIVIAPGNLYGSLAPALLVEGVAKALKSTRATVVFVCNLVNKQTHTAGYAVHDYAEEIERFVGKGVLDYVLYNTDIPSKNLLKRYALDREFPVEIDAVALSKANYKAIGGDFLSHARHTRNKNDRFIRRSLIRHDSAAVAKALQKLI